jgi:hypothetical protein
MLRDVVVHILNEQPLLADLVNEPAPSDVALICRNLRTMNGKRPVFVDDGESTFILPLASIRFLEIHRESVEAHEAENAAGRTAEAAVEADEELAARALARLGWLSDANEERYDGPHGLGSVAGAERPNNPDDLDGDLLRRIREA